MTHKPFVLLPLPDEWLNDTKLEPLDSVRSDAKIPAVDLNKLKELAMRAMARANERAKEKPVEDNATALVRALGNASHNGSAAFPTSYKNPTLAPYSLIIEAIYENRRHMGATALPKVIYISDALLKQLPKDMQYCIGEAFQGSIPFSQPDGKRRYVPVVSARNALDIILPKDTVWCAN